jgi:phage/plasmid-associated DNA primase
VARLGDERHLCGLVGKLLNVADELSAAAVVADTFKACITGETVSARDVYKSRIEFVPRALHVFATNVLPTFAGGMDRGVLRRLLVLEFNRTIPVEEQVQDIGRLIAVQESDLVLAWAVEGAGRLIARAGFIEPPSSRNALREWCSADPVLAWISAEVQFDPDCRTAASPTTAEAYKSFRRWAEDEGYRLDVLPAINGFVQRVQAQLPAGIVYKRTAHARRFVGMRIGRADRWGAPPM